MKTVTALLLLLAVRCASAQPGTVDTTFHSHLVPDSGEIRCVLALPDGKALIGGWFTAYDGVAARRLARLQPDGTLDNSFMSGSGFDDEVRCMALQLDGHILIGGSFESFDGAPNPGLVRLNPDGVLDTDFQPELSGFLSVAHLAILADGRILVAGNGVQRLMPDGSADLSFTVQEAISPSSLAVLSDGRILVGTGTQSPPFHCLTRLLADGAVDSTFTSRSFGMVGLSWASVDVIHEQPDGAYVVGGHFDAYDGVERIGLARIHSDATLDGNYNPPQAAWPAPPFPPMWWADVFTFLRFQGERLLIPKFGFNTRLHVDGTLDGYFHRAVAQQNGDGYGAIITGSARQPDGKILLVGSFMDIDGFGTPGIARLNDCVIGALCDDGDAETVNDIIDTLCTCSGESFTALNDPGEAPNGLIGVAHADGSGRFTIMGTFTGPPGPMTVTLHDVLGRNIYAERVKANVGPSRIEVVPGLSIVPGNHVVTLTGDRFRWAQRLHLP